MNPEFNEKCADAFIEKVKVLEPLMRAEIEKLEFKQRMLDCQRKVGEMLRDNRIKSGVSLRQIGKRLGFSAAFVSDVELGRRNVTITFADAFMEELLKTKK